MEARRQQVKIAVVNGVIIDEYWTGPGTILIGQDGRIAGVLAQGMPYSVESEIDAAGMYVFPGGVDAHVHFNDPGRTESEDFFTGTAGAAAGGYTTVLEMPQTKPLVDSATTLRDKLREVEEKAIVDFGLWAALVPSNARDTSALKAVAEAGAIGLKAFFCESDGLARVSESELAFGLANARRLGFVVAVHCETQWIIDVETDRLIQAGVTDVHEAANAHPAVSETEAARAVLSIARAVDAAVHLVHVSDPRTVQFAQQMKNTGIDVSVETCPHYLALTRADLKSKGVWAVCNPPLNTASAQDGLWRALRLGLIDNIASDHCAYTSAEKEVTDPWKVGPGINGIQVSLPLLVEGALRRDVPLPMVAAAFSAGPARRFSLYPKKGSIRPGSDGDLVIMEAGSPLEIDSSRLFSRCPGTPYEGMIINARIRRTLVRGVTVYLDEGEPEVVVKPGHGMFLDGQRARSASLA